MKHVFTDHRGDELCIMDDGGYEAVNYIKEVDSLIAGITDGKDDITVEDEAQIFAMTYAVQCSVNVLIQQSLRFKTNLSASLFQCSTQLQWLQITTLSSLTKWKLLRLALKPSLN